VAFAVFFGFVGVDAHDEVAGVAQGGGEVGDVGGFVFAAEEDLGLGDFAATGGEGDLLDEKGDSFGGVVNGEVVFEDVAVAVADEGEVFSFGVVDGDAEDFLRITGTGEDVAKGVVLAAVNGLCFF